MKNEISRANREWASRVASRKTADVGDGAIDLSEYAVWARNLAFNYVHGIGGDILRQIKNAAEELALDRFGVDRRWQHAQDMDLRTKEGMYFLLTGRRYPGSTGYVWASQIRQSLTTAAAGMPHEQFIAKVRRIMQKIAMRYGGVARGQYASGKTADGVEWSATISRHNASNGETFGRLDLTGHKDGTKFSYGEFWDWDKLFEKAGIPVVNAGIRAASRRVKYPENFFVRPGVSMRARQYGLTEVENKDLTGFGLAAKMQEWQESEGGVDAYVYDDALFRMRVDGVRMPAGIRRLASREARIARMVVGANKYERGDLVMFHKGGKDTEVEVREVIFNKGHYMYLVEGEPQPVPEVVLKRAAQ
jgi:hypothetical protein